MALSTEERGLFTAEQLVQLDRMSDIETRFAAGVDRARRLSRWATRSAAELRALANIAAVRWARSGIVLVPSADSDYSEADLAGITEELRGGDDWVAVAARVVAAGGSVEQRLAALGG